MVITKFFKKHFFVFLLSFAALVNLPFFLNKIPIYHDTFVYYVAFFNTYNSFFFHAELPRWLPYTGFGVQNDFLQIGVMPTDYFFILVGCLLKIQNVLLLYKISLFTTQVVYLLGTYKLAKDVFKNNFSVWLVCVCAAGSLVFKDQIYWGFTCFYLLPWMIFYFRKLLIEKNFFNFFFFAMISLLGSIPYFGAVVFLQFFVFFILLWIVERRQIFCWHKAPGGSSILRKTFQFFGVLFLATAYLYICFHPKTFIQILSVGRNLSTYEIPLNIFLDFGGHIGIEKFIYFIVPIHLLEPYSDLHIYLGITIWICVVYGIFRSKEPMFVVFLSISATLVLLSLGKDFSVFCYYFMPGMKFFRHIGLTADLLRFYIPFLAGFGLQALLNDVAHQKNNRLSYLFLFLGFFVIAASFFIVSPSKSLLWTILYPCLILAIVLFSFFFASWQKTRSPHLGILFVLFCLLELIVVQVLTFERFAKYSKLQPKSLSYVSRESFQLSRTSEPLSDRSKELRSYISAFLFSWHSAAYAFYFDFMQWDPCFCDFRIDFMNKYVYDFLVKTGNPPNLWGFFFPENSLARSAIGCQTPKIQLISKVVFSHSPNATLNAIKNNDTIVIANAPSDIQSSWNNYEKSKGSITINDFSPNRLSLTAFVPEQQGAWLYYKDGYHPDWKAKVNDHERTVYQANIAFKAIKVDYGLNTVELYFDSWKLTWCFYVLILGGLWFTALMLKRIFLEILHPDE